MKISFKKPEQLPEWARINKAVNKWARNFRFPSCSIRTWCLEIQFLQPVNVPCRKSGLSQLQTWPQLTLQNNVSVLKTSHSDIMNIQRSSCEHLVFVRLQQESECDHNF